MKSNRLLVISVISMVIGMTGISATDWSGDMPIHGGWLLYGSGMMGGDRMGGGPMMGMMQEMRSGRLPPGITRDRLPEPDSPGAGLLARYCHPCHNLPSPSMHTLEEWPMVEDRMFSRMEMMSSMRGMMGGMPGRHRMNIQPPTREEKENLLAYLQHHALTPAGLETLGAPDTPGLPLFRKTCSQCHALPSPALHSSDEWPAVVERMRGNMRTMGKRVITEEEAEQIAAYLGQHSR